MGSRRALRYKRDKRWLGYKRRFRVQQWDRMVIGDNSGTDRDWGIIELLNVDRCTTGDHRR